MNKTTWDENDLKEAVAEFLKGHPVLDGEDLKTFKQKVRDNKDGIMARDNLRDLCERVMKRAEGSVHGGSVEDALPEVYFALFLINRIKL